MKEDKNTIRVPKACYDKAIEVETIFGNRAHIRLGNIYEMVWYPTGYARIVTHFSEYLIKISRDAYLELEKQLGVKEG